MRGIETLSPAAASAEAVQALSRDGAVVVERLAEPALLERIAADFRPLFDKQGRKTESDFNGYATLRIGSVLAYARSAAELIGHRLVMEVADAILLRHAVNYRIGSTTAIEIHPGETQQVLHRDDSIYPLRVPGVEWQISALWALDDFTLENGATHVVPGSHRSDDPDGQPAVADSVQAVMPAGSVLFYLGSTWHGGGANRANAPRTALVNTYALGWLRQEVNQYLDVPPDVVAGYPEHIRRLIGYQKHGDHLGHHRMWSNPAWIEDWQRSGLPLSTQDKDL